MLPGEVNSNTNIVQLCSSASSVRVRVSAHPEPSAPPIDTPSDAAEAPSFGIPPPRYSPYNWLAPTEDDNNANEVRKSQAKSKNKDIE